MDPVWTERDPVLNSSPRNKAHGDSDDDHHSGGGDDDSDQANPSHRNDDRDDGDGDSDDVDRNDDFGICTASAMFVTGKSFSHGLW